MYETYNLIMLQLNAQATFIESIKFCNKKKTQHKNTRQEKKENCKFYAMKFNKIVSI